MASVSDPEGPMRIAVPLMVASLLAPIPGAQRPHPAQAGGAEYRAKSSGQVFRSGAATVAVYVTVTDQAGIHVPNLTKDDFEIYDNGKRQTITLFESGLQPITVILMLDRSGSM